MQFDHWWELNKRYCEGQSAKYIALRAWASVKAYHRISSAIPDKSIHPRNFIKIQFICEICTTRLIIECDESIWTFSHYCEECQIIRVFLRDTVICEDEPYELMPVSLYLFRAGERYKIGSSIDPERRLRDFSGSPIPVELIWASQVEDAKKIERQLHEFLKERRCHGEWFELNKGDIKYIKALWG